MREANGDLKTLVARLMESQERHGALLMDRSKKSDKDK